MALVSLVVVADNTLTANYTATAEINPPSAPVALPALAPFVTAPPGSTIRIRVSSPGFFDLDGHFAVDAADEVTPLLPAPASFTVVPNGLPSGFTPTIGLVGFLSRVRDATGDALSGLDDPAGFRSGFHPAAPWPPLAWTFPDEPARNMVDDPPLVGTALSFSSRPVKAPARELVFELKGIQAPRAVAVSWPETLLPASSSDQVPFLVVFHPSVDQAKPAFYSKPESGQYPFGLDFSLFELWQSFSFWTDPLLQGPASQGLPYQMNDAGKHAVIVKVSNAPALEAGEFTKPDPLLRYLREIRDFVMRSRSLYPSIPSLIAGAAGVSPLGRIAVGSFSNGGRFVGELLANSNGTTFFSDTLKEIYLFDPGPGLPTMPANVAFWANSGATADKMARLYHGSALNLSALIPAAPASGSFFLSNARFTVAAVSPTAWKTAADTAHNRAGNPAGFPGAPDAHHLFPAMFLTDALRRSGF